MHMQKLGILLYTLHSIIVLLLDATRQNTSMNQQSCVNIVLWVNIKYTNSDVGLTLQPWALVFKTRSPAPVELPGIHLSLMGCNHLVQFTISVLQFSNQQPQLFTLLLYRLVLKVQQTCLQITNITTGVHQVQSDYATVESNSFVC